MTEVKNMFAHLLGDHFYNYGPSSTTPTTGEMKWSTEEQNIAAAASARNNINMTGAASLQHHNYQQTWSSGTMLNWDEIPTLLFDNVYSQFEFFRQELEDFRIAVNWRKDGVFFLLLFSFHLQYLLAILFLKLSAKTCFLLFFCNAAICSYFLPMFNDFMRRGGEDLTDTSSTSVSSTNAIKVFGLSANYFDEDGWFVTATVGFPLLCLNVVLLLKILKLTFDLAATVTRRQLGRRGTTASSHLEVTTPTVSLCGREDGGGSREALRRR
ncbi:unnamed protein product [Amoebophrya sp. A120]|nr:unnamed protein product [Amoebophrya sp. A120]|eukprot:GSA120T00007022001.1